MKKCLIIALLGGSAVVCAAQTNRFPPINIYTGDPTGNVCTPPLIQQSSTTGLLYTCQGGTMKAGGSTGSGTVSGQSPTCLPKASGATALTQASSVCDNGTTVTTALPVASGNTVQLADGHQPVDVGRFGVLCDGSHDDTAGINAAIAAATGTAANAVSFPYGKTCKVSSTTGTVTLPGDNGTFNPALTCGGVTCTTLAPETPVTMPYSILVPNGLKMFFNNSTLVGTFVYGTTAPSVTQPIMLYVQGTYYVELHDLAISSALVGIYSAWLPLGVIQHYVATNVGFPLLVNITDRETISDVRCQTTAACITIGGWWQTRNSQTDETGGYADKTEIMRVANLGGQQPYNAYAQSFDTFFDTYFWKSANTATRGTDNASGYTNPNFYGVFGQGIWINSRKQRASNADTIHQVMQSQACRSAVVMQPVSQGRIEQVNLEQVGYQTWDAGTGHGVTPMADPYNSGGKIAAHVISPGAALVGLSGSGTAVINVSAVPGEGVQGGNADAVADRQITSPSGRVLMSAPGQNGTYVLGFGRGSTYENVGLTYHDSTAGAATTSLCLTGNAIDVVCVNGLGSLAFPAGIPASPSIVSGVPITPSLVTVNNQALSTASPLQPFVSGPLQSKLIMATGDSTTALALGMITAFCRSSNPGQEMSGLQCVAPATYSIDGSHNVTVVMATNLPGNCLAGQYISFDSSSTFQSNALNNNTGSNSTFLIASITPNSVTFSNPVSAGATGSTAANGLATCGIVNNGSNGATQEVFNVGVGLGGAGLVSTLQPDLDLHTMGINSVRSGVDSAAQLAAAFKTYIDTIRANSPKTSILLYTPNSLLADDPGSFGLVTSPSTTSSTAVAAGSVTITLATMLNSIAGLVTPDLTLANEAANAVAATVTATTGSITGGAASLVVASATGYTRGMAIKVVGAGAAGADLTTIIQSISGTTFTVAPQAATTVTGAAVTQTGTIYSAHLMLDSGANQEIVPITAINLIGGTVTVTTALSHSGTYTVVPTMATMSQAYTNILHDATMSFEGIYPNVQVVDIQPIVFTRLVQLSPQAIYMANQLHPGTGYTARTTYLAAILSKDRNFGGAHGTRNPNAGVPTPHYASVADYNPFRSIAAISNSYSACWTNGYFQCVENPDYYTFVGSGAIVSYGSASFIRFATETNALATVSSFGVLPVLSGDVMEIVGYGVAVASSAGSLFSTYTQVSTASTIPANLPSAAAIRVYRARYKSAAQELYAKSTGLYTYHHTVFINAGGTNFFRFSYTDAAYTWGGYYTTADVILLSDGTTQALTGCTLSQFSTYVQCAVTGSFAGIASMTGDIYGTHAQEGTYAIPGAPTSYTLGTNVTSCACASGSNCTTAAGSLTIVGGTATTGTICSPVWAATPAALKCGAWQNGGATFFGIGNAAASTTGFAITAGVSVSGATVTVNYSCSQ